MALWNLLDRDGQAAISRDGYAQVVAACPGAFQLGATQRVEVALDGTTAEVTSWTAPDRHGHVDLMPWSLTYESGRWRRVPSYWAASWMRLGADAAVRKLRREGAC